MRLPTLSPTKIVTFLACPYKYNWLYRDSRGKWFVRSKNYYSFGTSLHQVLEKFYNKEDLTVTNVESAVEALDRDWIDAGYSSAAEMSEALGEGKLILEHYINNELQRKKESRTLFVEKQVSKTYSGFRLLGRIDRIEEYEDGTIEIIDYKSGRQSVTPEEVQKDIAMGCYQLLVNHLFPDRKILATIIALRSGETATASMTSTQLVDFESNLLDLSRIILGEDFSQLLPKPNPLCADCDFLKLCSQNPEFDLADLRNIKQLRNRE